MGTAAFIPYHPCHICHAASLVVRMLSGSGTCGGVFSRLAFLHFAQVSYNGKTFDEFVVQRASTYIEQVDEHMAELTCVDADALYSFCPHARQQNLQLHWIGAPGVQHVSRVWRPLHLH